MFAFVSAFPKSLHCTDEAQQAQTVLSAVLSIYTYFFSFSSSIYIYIYKDRKKGVRINSKSLERQVYAPRLEPTAPIRLADRNHAHYPSRRCTILIKRWLNDGLPS